MSRGDAMSDFEKRFDQRANLMIDSRSKSPTNMLLRTKQKQRKSVTFQTEQQVLAMKNTPRHTRSSSSKFRLPRWARENASEKDRIRSVERACYSPSDYCLDLARAHNGRRCHTAASRCYLAALESNPGDRQVHTAFKTSLAFVRNNRPYFKGAPKARK